MKFDASTSYPVSSDSLFIGSAWYPEHWDRPVLEEDMKLMHKIGMNVVRIAEFAWSRMEPKEGDYQLGWLKEAIDLAHANGIRVVMCTPTATPPVWLLKKHPEIGYVEADGYRHKHGARQHSCYNNPDFRQHSRRITEVLAREFGKHPAVIAWQTDNEIRAHQKICVCPACHQEWVKWLKNRYGTVEELNKVWGTNVWSEHYDTFEDVPQHYRLCCWSHHFALATNYRRFMSDSAIAFQAEQVKIIHAHSPAPVTHNAEDSLDEWDLFETLDFASADIYIGYITLMRARMRTDMMRTIKPGRRYWVMETGCDSMSNNRMPFGQVACYNFFNYVSGSQAVLYWCWRQNRTGSEISHVSLVYSDSQTTVGWEEASKVSEARKKLEPFLKDYSPARPEVALVRTESNAHHFYHAGLEGGFSYLDKISAQYETLVELGAWRDVISDKAPFDGYKVIFTPYLPHASDDFLKRMEAHLNQGGAWVVGPYCGYREKDHTIPTNAILGQVEKMLGFKTKYFCTGKDIDISFAAGFEGKTQMYLTTFETAPGDEVLGTYPNGTFKGQAWGVSRAFGKGRVYVLGSEVDPAARAKLYTTIMDREKIERVSLPSHVARIPQAAKDGRKALALVNFGTTAEEVPLPSPGRDILTGKTVQGKITLEPCSNAYVILD